MFISQKNITVTRNLMFLINFLMVSFLSALIYKAIELICWKDMARTFLERIRCVPTIPWQVPVFSIFLLFLLYSGVLIRNRIPREYKPVFYLFSILDLVICIAIMFILNMSYKGILMVAISNIIIYIDGMKRKYLFIIAAIAVYILVDYDILSIKANLFSLNEYIQYYTSTQRLYIYGIRNILSSLNEMVFIVFMVFVIQGQIDEKMKIKELYDKLYQTAGELKIVNIQLQNYAKKSEEMAKTRERNRLAREIHDTLGHALTGIATGLEACIQIIDHNKEQTKKQLIKIIDLAKKGLLDVRRSVSELRPDALNRFLLIPAIQRLTEDINECTNTKVALFVNRETANLRPDEEETIYRIIQEGITNAVRHGKAKEIKVELCFETNHVQLEIADDGVGCSHPVEGFGLKHIKERIQMLAGWVKFESLIPSGFKISARIPIRGGLDNDSAFDSGRPGINQTKSGDYVEQ